MKNLFNFKLYILLAAVLMVSGALAQDEPIRVNTNIVTVNVAVTDAKGKFVKGLQKEQFEIFDNKVKQDIEFLSAREAPVTFGIVYDLHPTTGERTTAVLESLRAFTKNLRPKDDFFVVAFNERGSLTTDFIPTAEQLERQISPARQGKPDSLYDAIYSAADKLRSSPDLKRTLIIISDSKDHHSQHKFSDILKTLKSFDVQVYAVILDSNSNWRYSDVTLDMKNRQPRFNNINALDRAALSELTLNSGGTSLYPVLENAQELFNIYRQISSELNEQYTISFTPNVVDGKWHDLRVSLRGVEGSKKFALTYRQGYQSPSAKVEN